MKRRAIIISCAVVCFLGAPVSAASYTDDCTAIAADETRVYSGFSADIEDFSVFWDCGDSSVLSVSEQRADALYRVSGAETVMVELYTRDGTFATPIPPDGYRLAGFTEESFADAVRCLYDDALDTVFLTEGDKNYSLRLGLEGLVFREDSRAFNADNVYGVSFFASADGESFTQIDETSIVGIRSQYLEDGLPLYYKETYLARPPADTSYLYLQFTNCREIPAEPPSSVQERINNFHLGKVQFEGESLRPGPPEESSSVPEPPGSSSAPVYRPGGSGRYEDEESSDAESSSSARDKEPPRIYMGTNLNPPPEYGSVRQIIGSGAVVAVGPASGEEDEQEELVIHTAFYEEPAKPELPDEREVFGAVVGGGAGLCILAVLLRGLRR